MPVNSIPVEQHVEAVRNQAKTVGQEAVAELHAAERLNMVTVVLI